MDQYKKRKQKLIEERKKKPVVDDLPNIFREHGLPYLPAKSLHRFKSVCSIWKFWITNPFFSHRQSYSFRAISGVFYQPPAGSSSFSPPRFMSVDASAYGVPDPSLGFLPEPVRLKQSSNGLLCCWSPKSRTFYLCNPVTRQWRALPKSPRDHAGIDDPDVVLKFEPGSSFNFESEFALVSTIVSGDGEREFDIFSSKTNSWELSRELLMNGDASTTAYAYAQYAVMPDSGVYANKVAYWLMKNRWTLLAFDLVKDRASFVYLPIRVNNHSSGARLGQVDGRLCLAACHSGKLTLHLLSGPTAPWSRPTEVSIPHTLTASKRKVLAVQADGVVVYVDGRIFKYTPATGNFTTTTSTTNQAVSADLLSDTSTLLPYINSLVSF